MRENTETYLLAINGFDQLSETIDAETDQERLQTRIEIYHRFTDQIEEKEAQDLYEKPTLLEVGTEITADTYSTYAENTEKSDGFFEKSVEERLEEIEGSNENFFKNLLG